MKLNNKGFALTSIIYMLIVLFLMILLLILSNLAQRKIVLDKLKYDVKEKLNQGGYNVNELDRPYVNLTTGLYYETLKEAFDNAQDNQENTIKVLKSMKETVKPLVSTNKNIILDVNNQTISLDGVFIENDGSLNIKGKGTIESTAATIRNDGTMTTENEILIHGIGADNKTVINNFGTMTLTDTLVISDNYRSIYNQGTGIVTINGNKTEIRSKNTAVYNINATANTIANPSITISGGTIESTNGNTVYNREEGTIVISGNNTNINQTGTNTSIYNYTTGAINISGGNINASGGAAITNAASGIINVSGNPIITGNTNGITGKTGTVTVSGGTITGINNDGINITESNSVAGSATVTGGTIIGGRTGIIAESGAATVTVGIDDNNLDITSPIIISKNTSTGNGHGVGIYIEGTNATGTINFYDGIVKGPLDAISLNGAGATQNLPANGLYEIENGTENIEGITYQTQKLKLK